MSQNVRNAQNPFISTAMEETRKASPEELKDEHKTSDCPKRPTNIPTRDSSCPANCGSEHTANAQNCAITDSIGLVSARPPWNNIVSDRDLTDKDLQ